MTVEISISRQIQHKWGFKNILKSLSNKPSL